MATDKECECIKSTASVVMWASGLESNALIGEHYEDIKFKKPVSIGPIFKELNTLSQLVYRDAFELRKDLEKFDKTCDLSPAGPTIVNNYKSGKAALDQVIKSEGKDMGAAFYAGARINDSMQDALALKKLIPCK